MGDQKGTGWREYEEGAKQVTGESADFRHGESAGRRRGGCRHLGRAGGGDVFSGHGKNVSDSKKQTE